MWLSGKRYIRKQSKVYFFLLGEVLQGAERRNALRNHVLVWYADRNCTSDFGRLVMIRATEFKLGRTNMVLSSPNFLSRVFRAGYDANKLGIAQSVRWCRLTRETIKMAL